MNSVFQLPLFGTKKPCPNCYGGGLARVRDGKCSPPSWGGGDGDTYEPMTGCPVCHGTGLQNHEDTGLRKPEDTLP